jgi:hypothetical protein
MTTPLWLIHFLGILFSLYAFSFIGIGWYMFYINLKYQRYILKENKYEGKSLSDKIRIHAPFLSGFSIKEGDDETVIEYKLKMRKISKYILVTIALIPITFLLLVIATS